MHVYCILYIIFLFATFCKWIESVMVMGIMYIAVMWTFGRMEMMGCFFFHVAHFISFYLCDGQHQQNRQHVLYILINIKRGKKKNKKIHQVQIMSRLELIMRIEIILKQHNPYTRPSNI